MRYRKSSANTLFAFCARNIPYLQTVPFGPNWPDDADTHKVLGRSTSRTLHGMKTATAARIPQRGSAPSAPVHCRTERARARPTPSACAPTITTTLAPGGPPSRARRSRGRWPEGRSRTCGKHTESSKNSEQICRAQVQTVLELRIWGVYAPFFQQDDHLRVDDDRRPKSRPLSSALRGMEALLALVEVKVHLSSRILLTAAPGR